MLGYTATIAVLDHARQDGEVGRGQPGRTVNVSRDRRLTAAAGRLPGVEAFTNDIATPEGRQHLADHVRQTMPELDVLINNAGIQRREGIASDQSPWAEAQHEINTLFAAPVHLGQLLIPYMLAHGRPSVLVNVTSGGAFFPQPFAPLYSAAEAALHSYTMNLRHALKATPVRVVELIPPAVATELAGRGQAHGADPLTHPERPSQGTPITS